MHIYFINHHCDSLQVSTSSQFGLKMDVRLMCLVILKETLEHYPFIMKLSE